MPICAIQGCSNGELAINQWKSESCPIHPGTKKGMSPCDCLPPFKLFPFPTERRNPEGRKIWTQLVNRKDAKTQQLWTPKSFSRICSRHFIDGSPTLENPNPTLHLGYQLYNKPQTRKPPRDRSSVEKRTTETTTNETEIMDTNSATNSDCRYQLRDEHSYSSLQAHCENCLKLKDELNRVKHLNDQLETRITEHHSGFCVNGQKSDANKIFKRFVNNDTNVRLHTGLRDKAALDNLYSYLLPNIKKMRYWTGSKKITVTKVKVPRKFKKTPKKGGMQRCLLARNELILVLMKLRIGLTNCFLCSTLNISAATCSKIVNTWIRFLARELKPLIYWPDREAVRKLLPPALLSKYPNLCCTLDCTEIFINRPRHLKLQYLTWSDYKKHHTVKYLIGIAPNGMISFLSDGWGGRTSDKYIVNQSGFLDLVGPGDIILADRGFTINAELLMRGAKLEIPPPSSGWEQQTPANVAKTKKIANARIHVERAIGRMKCFGILKNTVPINNIPILDDIVFVCCALCNLLPPLVGC